MLYKRKPCPDCNGRGFITGYNDYSIWSAPCTNCNREGFILDYMTNGDVIRKYCSNEYLRKIIVNLENYVLTSGGDFVRMLHANYPEDVLEWLDKITDKQDLETIFSFIDVDKHNAEYLTSAAIVVDDKFLTQCKEVASKYEIKEESLCTRD